MALYRYMAIDEKGKKQSNIIDAMSLSDAKQNISKMGLLLYSLEEVGKKDSKKGVNKKDIVNLTRELAKLLEAGLPLYESLLALEEKYQGQKMHYLVMDLAHQVKSGKPFSLALSSHAKSFDFLYCSMVANAEKSGNLTTTLMEISLFLKKQMDLKKKFLSSLLYPSMIGLFALVVLFFLLFFVIPSLFDLYEGRELHPFTQMVFSVSRVATTHKLHLFLLFFSLIGGVCGVMYSSKGKRFLRGIILTIPLIRPLMIKVALVRFCRSLSTLLEGGVSYVQAIELATDVMNHPLLEKELKEGKKRIIEGEKLSSLLSKSRYMPPLVGRLIAIAEEGGGMSQMLKHLSEIYEEEVEKTLYHITTILQPLLLLALGVVVGFVVLSVLLPLTDVSSFINS